MCQTISNRTAARRISKLCVSSLAIAVLGAGAPGWAADVNITSDVSTGVNLDSQIGSTAEISPGVTVTNAALSKAVTATVAAWQLTNRGTISSTNANTVQLDKTGSSVINYGAINAGAVSNAIQLTGGGTVDNKAGATITSSLSSVIIGTTSAGVGTFTNAGTITQTGTAGDLVQLRFGGVATNLAGGVISANNTSNALSVGQGASREVYNYGTITNTGTSFATGVLVQGGASTVTNYAGGKISGTFNGVFASASTPMTFTNAGLIESTGANVSARAVEATGGGTLINSGTIQSASSDGLFVGRAATVTNSGTIKGAVRAINFSGNFARTLNLDTGSVLIGTVQGGTGVDDLVLLGTNSETIAKFLAFETIAMKGSAWTLTGVGSFATSASVQSGTLTVDGTLTSPTMTVASGGTLTGKGTIAGATTIADSATLAGKGGQALTMNSLALNNLSNVNVTLGAPSTSALFKVIGALTLDGQLNIANGGGFDYGSYRLFDYGGALTNNGLVVQSVPLGFNPGDWTIDIATAGQVNLNVIPGAGAQYWDGANMTPGSVANGRGGSGVWNTTNTNWTNAPGTINAAWVGQKAVFAAAGASTVTIEGPQGFTGLRFLGNANYTFNAGTSGGLVTTGAMAPIVTDQAVAETTTVRIAAPISGTGGIAKSGAGALVLTGTNSYAGGTSIAGGTLSLGDGGTSGSILGNVSVAAGASFAINRSDASSFSGAISGAGAFTKLGAGTLTLSGNSAAFAGTGMVQAGVLDLAGSLGGSLTVASGARLQGVGTGGALSIASGATIAPGNSIGTLSADSITFASGSIYEVEANNVGQADRISLTAGATINGGTVKVLAQNGSYALNNQYIIVSAGGGVSGNGFDTVTSNLAFLTPSLQQTANSVILILTRNNIDLDAIGGTRNQRSAGRALQDLNAGPIFDAVLSLDVPGARAAFDAISGEIHPSLRTTLFEDSRFPREAVLRRLQSAAPERTGIWAEAFGDWGSSDSDGNAARLRRDSSGVVIGLDTMLGKNWRAGVAGGYSHHAMRLPGRDSSGRANMIHALVYAGARYGPVRLSFGAGYAHVDARTHRTVDIPGFADRLNADYNGSILQGFGELGYRIGIGGGAFEPFARVAVVRVHTDRFSEDGGPAALRGESASATRTTSTLGVHLTTPVAGGLSVDARLGWRHAFGDATPVSTLHFAGGGGFDIAGVPYSREAGVAEGGITFQASARLALWARYSGVFGDRGQNNAVKGGVSLRF